MPEVKIAAESRTTFGKGAARAIRREDKVPAVLYGHGTDPRHLTLPGHEVLLALRTPNVLIKLEGAVDELALPKGIQRDPIKGFIEHVDLLLVRRGEKVTVDIPVVPVGDIAPGGILDQQMISVSVEAEATHIPGSVEVDITGLEVGAQVTAGDLKLPEGTTLVADPEALILHVTAPAAEPVEEEAGEAFEGLEGEAPAEAAESEAESE